MESTREEQVRFVLSRFKTLGSVVQASRMPELMQLDLSMAQFRTLMILGSGGPKTIGQIAHELKIGQSTAGHLVDRLVKAGYACRAEDAEDRRRTVVQTTSAGQAFYEHFASGSETIARYLSELADDDLKALYQGLDALYRMVCAKQGLSAPPSPESAE